MRQQLEEFLTRHFSATSGIQPYDDAFLLEFLKLGPLHEFIPTSDGGRCTSASSYLDILDRTSYHSLPLGLTLGITGALFLQPIVRLHSFALRKRLLRDFLQGTPLGGLMITEPTGGTDIFGLRSTYERRGEHVVLNGAKCWGGLTGRAEHWLVAARERIGDRVTRNVALIYVPLATEGVRVHERFDALGLQPIPYGETRYENVTLPADHVVTPSGPGGLRTLYDLIFRSRMAIPAGAAGHCQRLFEVASARAQMRRTFGRPICGYDQVQHRLDGLLGSWQLCRALKRLHAHRLDTQDDLSGDALLVNSSKIVSSELLFESADSAVQLFASAAFKRDHLVGRAYVDVRAYRIFEGSNDVLDENCFDAVTGRAAHIDRDLIGNAFNRFGLTPSDAVPASAWDAFEAATSPSQRQKVALGRMLAWIMALSGLERQDDDVDAPLDAGVRIAQQRIASLAASLPYLK